MSHLVSEAEAFGILQTRRAHFVRAAAPALAGVVSPDDAAQTASTLLQMMIAAYEGSPAPSSEVEALPRKAFIAFGDNLVPLLKDIVGEPPVGFLSRCVDAYWRSAASVLEPA